MNDINWDFLISFVMAWLIQAMCWSYDKWRSARLLAQALRDDPTGVMHSLQKLRDSK